MAAYDFDIGVIGGGAAGLTVASGSAQAGAKTLLIEKERALGGDCLHYGCVPSKTLIRTAHVYHLIRNARIFGLPEIAVPTVDFRDVAARIRTVIGEIERHDSVDRFCRLGVRVEFGTPAFIDDHAIEVGGRTVSARTWVIATGSSPALPPIEGLERTPYITNREVFSLDYLPRSMIILGAGPIAIEMAQAFNRLGTEVSVVQRGKQILSREDRDMADLLMDVLSGEGVRFHLQSTVISVKDLGHARQVEIESAADGKRLFLQAETIFVAMGRSANAGGLGLGKIGISFDRKGIPVDNRLRTTLKHVYAAGDVTGQYLFTHAAGYEGGVVVGNAVFHLPRKVDYTFLPWCTYTDPELASIGLNEKSAETSGKGYSVRIEEFRNNDRALAEGQGVGRIKMIIDEHEKPIGIQMIGPRAGELISEWVAVLNGKVKIATLAAAVHPYPTLGEINKKVAGGLVADKIFSEKVRRGLKLFFGFKGRACKPGRCQR